MKKILIQYLYIFGIATTVLFFFTWVSACEVEEVNTKDLPVCEEYQVSTEEKPCVFTSSTSQAFAKVKTSIIINVIMNMYRY